MTEFNKQQYFEDTDAALRNDDPSLSDNDNANLLSELSEEEQMQVVEDLTEFLIDSDEKEENQNVKDMVKYLESLAAGVKLSKLLQEVEDSNSDSEAGKERSDTVADEDEASTMDSKEDESGETESDSEGTDPAQEAKEGKSEA